MKECTRIPMLILISLLALGALRVSFSRTGVEAWTGTIYISADGTINPQTAPLERNGSVYIFTGDTTSRADGIVIERSNITLDGNNYIIQGPRAYSSRGIFLSRMTNVTILNLSIREFAWGVLLDGSSGITFIGNNLTNCSLGIELNDASDNTLIRNCVANCTYRGIALENSPNNILTENIVENCGWVGGICIESSANNTLTGNIMKNSESNLNVHGVIHEHFVQKIDDSNTVDGKPIYYLINKFHYRIPLNAGYVALIGCINITIENLTLANNYQGILLAYTFNSTIVRNRIAKCRLGIYLYESSYNEIVENSMTANGIGVHLQKSSYNDISINSIEASEGFAGIFIESSKNNKISENDIRNNKNRGLEINASSDNSILTNNVTNNHDGILLFYSSNNQVSDNNVANNEEYGISLHTSSSNALARNNISACMHGIDLWQSSSNIVLENNVRSNSYGIFLRASSNCNLAGNAIVGNEYNFGIVGESILESLDNFAHTIEASNLVNNKPVYYLINKTDLLIDSTSYPEIGYLGLTHCNNVTVEGLNLTHNGGGLLLANTTNSRIATNNLAYNDIGLYLFRSSNNIVSGNGIRNNGDGIALYHSSNNSITRNEIEMNTWAGIKLLHNSTHNDVNQNNIANDRVGITCMVASSHNIIYLNNFLNNTVRQVHTSYNAINVWNKAYPLGGNYWDDYNGEDTRSGLNQNLPGTDGIGDIPYVIDERNQDNYPLMEPISKDFAISVYPTSQTVNPGESTSFIITLACVGDFSRDVSLSHSLEPASNDIKLEFSPDLVSLPRGGFAQSTLTAETRSTTPIKRFSIAIIATGKEGFERVTVALSVEVVLEVPYLNQDRTGWCGPSSLAMGLRYYGVRFHNWDYKDPATNLPLPKYPLIPAVTLARLQWYVVENYDWLDPVVRLYSPGEILTDKIRDDIKSDLKLGAPVILRLNHPLPVNNHFFVISGYNETGFFINDPSGIIFGSPYLDLASVNNFNHAFVTWENWAKLRQYIPTGENPATLSIYETPLPTAGTLYFSDDGIAFRNPTDMYTDYYFLDLDFGLTWKHKALGSTSVDPIVESKYSKLHWTIFLSNSRPTVQSFTVSSYIKGADNTRYNLPDRNVQLGGFGWGPCSWVIEDYALPGSQPYNITFNLWNTDGYLVDSFTSPSFYYLDYGALLEFREGQQQHLYLHIYDDLGFHTGVDYSTNQTELDIPNSYYFDDMNGTITATLPSNISRYRVAVDASFAEEEIETYRLKILVIENGQILNRKEMKSTILKGTVEEYLVEICEDGDVAITSLDRETFPFWVVGIIMIATLFGAGVCLYFTRFRKKCRASAEKHACTQCLHSNTRWCSCAKLIVGRAPILLPVRYIYEKARSCLTLLPYNPSLPDRNIRHRLAPYSSQPPTRF